MVERDNVAQFRTYGERQHRNDGRGITPEWLKNDWRPTLLHEIAEAYVIILTSFIFGDKGLGDDRGKTAISDCRGMKKVMLKCGAEIFDIAQLLGIPLPIILQNITTYLLSYEI